MVFTKGILVLFLCVEILPLSITGLTVFEGETVTMTCPSFSLSRVVRWEGPPEFINYTDGSTVNVQLPLDIRTRVSLDGNHTAGEYNLRLYDVRKSDTGNYRCLIGSRIHRKIRLSVIRQGEQPNGLFPNILNLATRARISANATCGENKLEFFCKLVEHVDRTPVGQYGSHCDYCNARASPNNPEEQGTPHPITNAIDGSNKWWQSPSISNGVQYNYVTITLDLELIYQVAYVIIKAANSPRPGNWILEKSKDGINYDPWQYFVISDEDCERLYNIPASLGVPTYDYIRDDEVRCTSYYSKLNPLENGEIFVSLTNGRPGIYTPSSTLLDFTSARYVRLRLQKIRTLNADLMTFRVNDPRNIDPIVTRRYFYSIKDISIGGQCICYGHASNCMRQGNTDEIACVCKHNTCGTNCEKCCPLFNQTPWRRGNNGNIETCGACNCHGHADVCEYNATVDTQGLSLNLQGLRSGGGVCLNCKAFTTGVNCERCLQGYYRPLGVLPTDPKPCRQCTCSSSVGNTGICVEDDTHLAGGLRPGDCVCREGYSGPRCDQCAAGYHKYPSCMPCPCKFAGSLDPSVCEGRCVCKKNVEGERCDCCRPGFYNLQAENPDGCMPCFCFGISAACQSANLGIIRISDMRGSMDGWTITTLHGNGFTFFPTSLSGWLQYETVPSRAQNTLNTDRLLEDEVMYYWQSPLKYHGSRLTSYGGKLHFTLKFTIDERAPYRQHLAAADVILQGSNITVTTGKQFMRENQENKVSVTLVESNFHRVDASGRNIEPGPVSKRDFMLVLYDLQRILIRATYHTAQNWIYLKDVVLEAVSAGSMEKITIPTVEKCACPRGYAGLSCESCELGWRRVNNVIYGGQCVPCNCYGHAKQCDPYTGKCRTCFDNTAGDSCEICAPGYYGDPKRGTPDDCKPCACPLPDTRNNFASQCVLSSTPLNPNNYVCLNCLPGYAGNRCDRCANGYFGFPLVPGNYCQPCACNGNIDPNIPGSCDQQVGKCLICQSNTEGNQCQFCREGYYGTAINGDCKLCDCHPDGSRSMICDRSNGQCECKERFIGQRCDRCQAGYGNIERSCLPCNCSKIGSLDVRCHPMSGQCVCRPGIMGLTCDHCQNGYYGYSQRGCLDCRCYPLGANRTNLCDQQTGVCNCLPNVTGSMCDSCKAGYYNLEQGEGCKPCQCNTVGSYFDQCDARTGQCRCRPGVTGLTCNECKPGYYGLSTEGCKECLPCKKPGYICDPVTGKCVCPPNTVGPECQRCAKNTWGYHPFRGCKLCECDPKGSLNQQCNPVTGQCNCKIDYTGRQCNQCFFGLYGFPDCKPCLCSLEGTDSTKCNENGSCQCQQDGQCFCKKYVAGRTCNMCKKGSFSLDVRNPDGCTNCFCFERAEKCSQAPYVWTWVAIPDRYITFDPRANYFIARQPNGFYAIPENITYATLPSGLQGEPLFWKVPSSFLGDMVQSYNGELKFTVSYSGPRSRNSDWLARAPLVVLVGNGIPIIFKSDAVWRPGTNQEFTVKLHESLWTHRQGEPVSRNVLIVLLQNVTEILIRATWNTPAETASLTQVRLQSARPSNLSVGPPALGVEVCECSAQYSGLSCQDPAEGYYRVPNPGVIDFNDLTSIIGDVALCACNQHSKFCDGKTGICQNCKHNTTGPNCEKCAPGFYGDPTQGTPVDCQPCACPLEIPSNNFSPTCERTLFGLTCTQCKTGYEGNRCEYCAPGYFGNPLVVGGSCKPCSCNKEGSLDTSCDLSGQCVCLPGISGKRCDYCQLQHAVEEGRCISCDEGCTGFLMKDLDELENMTARFDFSNVNLTLPIGRLRQIQNETAQIRILLEQNKLAEINDVQKQVQDVANESIRILNWSEKTKASSADVRKNSSDLLQSAVSVEDRINGLQKDVRDMLIALEKTVESVYFNRSGLNTTAAFEQAKRILAEIQARNFTNANNMAELEKDAAERLLEGIHNMSLLMTNTSGVERKLQYVEEALMDLWRKSNDSEAVLEETRQKFDSIHEKINMLKEKVMNIKEERRTMRDMLQEGNSSLVAAKAEIEKSDDNIKVNERALSRLDAAIDIMQNKVDDMGLKLHRARELAHKAIEHAKNLTNYARELEELFKGTRDLAADPLKAAKVYETIVSAIEEAQRAAMKAIQDIQNATAVANVDKIEQEVDQSVQRSRDLLDEARKLLTDRITGLRGDLANLNTDLDKERDKQEKIRQDIQKLNEDIADLPSDLYRQLDSLNVNLENNRRNVGKTNGRVDVIMDRYKFEILPKLNELRGTLSGNYTDVRQKIADARRNMNTMYNLTIVMDQMSLNYRVSSEDLRSRLKTLKQKIQEAREEANKIKVSLSAEGKCVKKFRPIAMPGTVNSISFAFKTTRPADTMMIILIQKSKQEFLSVELVNRKVRFNWNIGGGVGSVTHDTTVVDEGSVFKEAAKWYRVNAERTGRTGQLNVYSLAEPETPVQTGTSPIGFTLLKFNEKTELYVAGVPANLEIHQSQTKTNFTGCIGSLTVDGQPVGLHNFNTTIQNGCSGCEEVPAVSPGVNVYQFNGNGYAVTAQVRIPRQISFNMVLEFKTYWENATLFFAGNSSSGEFTSVELQNGQVVFQFYLGAATYGRTASELKYNRNKWVEVSIDRLGKMAMMTVDQERKPLLSSSPPGDTFLDVQNSDLFFGGIPGDANMSIYGRVSGATVLTTPFLGCMRGIQINAKNINLWQGKTTVGVKEGCAESGYRTISFYGEGFAEISASSLGKASADLSVSFVTKSPEALLLLAKTIDGDSFYSMSLIDGQLEARFREKGGNITILKSTKKYNDGSLRNAAVQKTNEKLVLLMDDEKVADGSLPSGTTSITVREDGGLYLGGVPEGINIDSMASTTKSLNGCISDVVINGRMLDISQPSQYERADIGRCLLQERISNQRENIPPQPLTSRPSKTMSGPQDIRSMETQTTKTTTPAPAIEGSCVGTGQYQYEKVGAVTYGDTRTQYHTINVTRREIKKKFEISFDFRTYFEYGVLIFATNDKKQTYLNTQLKQGQIEVAYYDGKNMKRILSGQTVRYLADGNWHSVQISKTGGAISLVVDKARAVTESVKKTLDIAPPMYVGGLPTDFVPQNGLVSNNLRGCLSNLKVNSVSRNVNALLVDGIDQCFTRIVPGVYFSGKSYGIYDNNFVVGNKLEITLDFRTHKQHGILLHVSNRDGRQSMTLQLHDGKLLFGVRNAGGNYTAITKDPYKYCNNQWHKIQANVIDNVVTLQVDGDEPIAAPSPGATRQTETNAPLYIGGTPEFRVSGTTLITDEKFEGCMRDLRIGNQLVDWFSLKSDFQIYKTACPTT